nr:uncharacterized protein LOC109174707 [Ipomoea trifida]
MDTRTSSKQGAGLEGDEFHEIECELSEELFRSLENSEESDGEVNAIDNVFQQTNLIKEGFVDTMTHAIGVFLPQGAIQEAPLPLRHTIQSTHVAEMEDREAGMEEVVAEEVQVEGQFEDIAVETQVPSFVLDEMELRNSQPSQAVQNQAPSLSEFISAQLPSESSTPNVITRSGRNYVTVATLQHSKAVQRETRNKRTTTKKK